MFPWFSSDASRLAVWGGLAAVLAGIATWRERKRLRRSNLDEVGWVPWTPVFVLALLAALVLLGLAAREGLNPA